MVERTSFPAQTERRGGAGPVRGLLGGKDPTGRFRPSRVVEKVRPEIRGAYLSFGFTGCSAAFLWASNSFRHFAASSGLFLAS